MIEKRTIFPDAEESKTFRISIWNKAKAQNKEAQCFHQIKKR